MNSHYAFFSFQILTIKLTDSPPIDSLVLHQPAPRTYKVLQQVSLLKQIAQQLANQNIKIVCFSAKKPQSINPIFKEALPGLRWIYVKINPKAHPNLCPNHAKLLFKKSEPYDTIEYGEGFSACDTKQQLLIAIQSALKISEGDRKQILVFEKDKKQGEFLIKKGYGKIFKEIPSLQQLRNKISEKYQMNYESIFDKLVSKSENLPDILNTYWGYNHFQDKKTLTIGITGNKPLRMPSSRAICSLVFMFQANKRPYLIKTDIPDEIGGKLYQEKQQNKVLASVLYQVMFSTQSSSESQAYYCLPMQLMHTNIRHSLIKAYDTKKAIFFARPYVNCLKTVAELKKSQQQLINLLQTGVLDGKKVNGIGKVIGLSLLMGQNLGMRSLFSSIVLFQPKDSFKNFEQQTLQCCKIDFSSQLFNLFEKQHLHINLLLSPSMISSVYKIAPRYHKQIQKTLIDCLNCFPLIQGAMLHPSWISSKSKEFKTVKQNLFTLCKYFKVIDQDYPFQNFYPKVKDLGSINPVYINYLIARDNDFRYFTQKPVSKFKFSFDTMETENQFIEKMKQNSNFIVYGSLVPVFSLMKWIRSYLPSTEVEYISLIQRKPDYYVTRTKVAKNEGKKKIFIVDHCELEGQNIESGNTIADQNRGFKTIFIYRLQPSNCKRLKIIHSHLNFKTNMIESQEQLQKALVFLYDREFLKGNIFKCRYSLIQAWIRNKWSTYIEKSGLFSFEELCDSLRKLVELIAHKRNRLGSILKNQRFPDVSQRTANSQMTLGTNPTSNLTEIHPYLKQFTQSQLILYCLPVYIEQQKVYLIHDFYSFLQAYNLYEDILNLSWSGEFQADQLEHFLIWFEELSPYLRKEMVSRIQQRLEKLYKIGLKEGSVQKKCNDCLELLRKIGANKFFSKHQWIEHYNEDELGIWKKQDSLIILQKDLKFIEIKDIDFKKPTSKQYVLPADHTEFKIQQLLIVGCQKLGEDQKLGKTIFSTLFCIKQQMNNPNKLLNLQQWTHVMQQSQGHKIEKQSIKLILPNQLGQGFLVQKKLIKLVKISSQLYILFNEDGCFCMMGVRKQGQILETEAYVIQDIRQNIKGVSISQIQVFFKTHQISNQISLMVGIACESKMESTGIDTLFVTNFKLSLTKIQNKMTQIVINNVNSHLLPQYGPISCFGMFIDAQDEKRVWISSKGSDSLAEWVLGNHESAKFCCCCPVRRIFRMEPDPIYIDQLNSEYLLVGSKMNFIKKMKLNW